jgi:hypothetical protein
MYGRGLNVLPFKHTRFQITGPFVECLYVDFIVVPCRS